MFDAFYADPHFGHKNICMPDYADRPYSSVEQMREDYILKYNACVKPKHTCLWLGDIFLCSIQEAADIIRRLNGKKVMLRGNHDKGSRWLVKAGVDAVIRGDYITMEICNRIVRACHYPYAYDLDPHNDTIKERYPYKRKGEILIHGHTHSRERVRGTQVHVGVDAWDGAPVIMRWVETIIKRI